MYGYLWPFAWLQVVVGNQPSPNKACNRAEATKEFDIVF